jgi:hypothetical protein
MLALAVEHDVPQAYRVALSSLWRSHATGEPQDAEIHWLRRDLPGGEILLQSLPIPAPITPGTYELEMTLRQVDGARFDGPGNIPMLATVAVLEPPPEP